MKMLSSEVGVNTDWALIWGGALITMLIYERALIWGEALIRILGYNGALIQIGR